MAARIHKGFFTKVKIARQLLRDKAEELLAEYLDVIQKAKDAGEYETAAKELRWLLEHIADDEGDRMVGMSVDKQQQVLQAPTQPTIQIGIQVGGVGPAKNQKALPATRVIDVKPDGTT